MRAEASWETTDLLCYAEASVVTGPPPAPFSLLHSCSFVPRPFPPPMFAVCKYSTLMAVKAVWSEMIINDLNSCVMEWILKMRHKFVTSGNETWAEALAFSLCSRKLVYNRFNVRVYDCVVFCGMNMFLWQYFCPWPAPSTSNRGCVRGTPSVTTHKTIVLFCAAMQAFWLV